MKNGVAYELFVRVLKHLDNSEAVAKGDFLMFAGQAPAAFPRCSRINNGLPVRETDGTWKVKVFEENALDLVREILTAYKVEIVREEKV